MRILKWIAKIGGWFAILIGVLFLISTLTFHTGLAGSGAGTGVFSYWFRANLDNLDSMDDFESAIGSFTIEGRAPSRFKIWGHDSPNYSEVQMDWSLYSKGRGEGRATVHLDRELISWNNETIALNAENVAIVLGVPEANERDRILIDELITFLKIANTGDLPPPNHHGHSLQGVLSGRMQHFATGFSLRPLELSWVICWSAFGFLGLISWMLRQRQHKPNNSVQTTRD